MNSPAHEPDPLDHQSTLGGPPSDKGGRPQKAGPPGSQSLDQSNTPGTPASAAGAARKEDTLDRAGTAAPAPSTSSDLGALVEGWEGADVGEPLEQRYDLRKRLGSGGMGEVWEALDRRLNRPVAVKRLKPGLVSRRGAIQRFLKEAQAVARLSDYHIIQVHDFGQDRQGPYLVMELAEGESLAAIFAGAQGEPDACPGVGSDGPGVRGVVGGASAGDYPPRHQAGEHRGNGRGAGETG